MGGDSGCVCRFGAERGAGTNDGADAGDGAAVVAADRFLAEGEFFGSGKKVEARRARSLVLVFKCALTS